MDKKSNKEKKGNTPKKVEKPTKVISETIIRDFSQDEVNLAIEVKEIRYGRRVVLHPEITTMVNNAKVVMAVPFESPLKYSFRKTEDEMVFKFAITSAGDLLGFVYMEIPQKFKTIKKFKLDDWFPVKLVQTEDREKLKAENFVARVVINYESTRKLETSALNVTPKTLRTQLAEDTSKNLRQKIDNIHEEVDAFHGEGFKHMDEFHKKLMTKKILSTTQVIELGKKEALSRSPNKLISSQKEAFYKGKITLGQTEELKKDTVQAKNMFNRHHNASTDNLLGRKTDSCLNCENLMKELSFTRKELIEANQKISQLEDKQMSVDNVALRKKLEKLQDDLNRDRKELSLKLKNHGDLLEQERAKLLKAANEDMNKATSLQKEASGLIAEYKVRFRELQEREQDLETNEADYDMRLAKLTESENEYIEHMKHFLKERDEYFRDKEEWEEIKKRMIEERKRINEEANKFHFLKTDIGLKKEQLQSLDEYFGDEKNKFRKEMDSKIAQIEDLKYELAKKQEMFDLEQRHFFEQQKSLEDKNDRLTKEMKKISTETEKLNALRSQLNQHKDQFQENKDQVAHEHQTIFDEIEQDYLFIDQQLKILEEQKKEINKLKETLEGYEKSLDDQNRIHKEQQARFAYASKQFLLRINGADCDVDQIRRIADTFVNDFRDAETKFSENQKMASEIQKERLSIKKSIDFLVDKSRKSTNLKDRKSIHERRNTKKFQDISGRPVSKTEFINMYGNPDQADASMFDHSMESHHMEVKDRQIEELQEVVANQQKVIADFQNNLKSAQNSIKLGDNVSKKSKDGSFQLDQSHLGDLQIQVEVVLAQTIQNFKAINGHQMNSQKYSDRLKSIESGQKVIRAVFKMITQAGDLQKENTNFEADFFDHEKIVTRYEKKIADLIEFIQRVKNNTDFFNNNMDNEILIR